MCGFIASKNVDLDLSEVIDKIKWRGLPGFEGYLTFTEEKMYLDFWRPNRSLILILLKLIIR